MSSYSKHGECVKPTSSCLLLDPESSSLNFNTITNYHRLDSNYSTGLAAVSARGICYYFTLTLSMMALIVLLFTLGTLLLQAPIAVAQSCWRSTECDSPALPAFPGAWDEYNLSPTSRTVSPVSYFKTNTGAVSTFTRGITLSENGDQVIFDFGKLVGGITTVTYSATGSGQIGLAWTEAKNYTGQNSDFSNGSGNEDGALFGNVTATSSGSYTVPDAQLRGGFRYLTVFASSSTAITITIQTVTLEISYQPEWSNLRAYQGYFSCSDDLLNKIWYSGAYTLQTNAIPAVSTGRHFPILGSGWANDENLDLGTSIPTIYVDGSKRDRTAWSGDGAIATRSILVSLGDWNSSRNTLNVFYNGQQSTGELPFAGPAINIYGSDTYHMATMIGTYDYYMFTNDNPWLNMMWSKYKAAMAFIIAKIDSTGLLDVTGTNDWGRLTQGGHNTEANMLLYKALTSGSQMATYMGDTSSSSTWATLATTLQTAINNAQYDSTYGAYKNTDTDASIYPQDANSMALYFGVATSANEASISTALTKNWISIGAVAPELPNNLIGFGQSFEIKGHLAARHATRALQLIRAAWGWYLSNEYGTNSTCIEGYLADGTFGYRNTEGYPSYSYTSHAHGWSTGPTDALTSFILGLTLTGPGGKQWQLAPQFGDLTNAQGGFTTPLGPFSASWQFISNGYTVGWNTPAGTTGTLVLPAANAAGQAPTVSIDGAVAKRDSVAFNATTGLATLSASGGKHTAMVVLA